MATKVSIRKTSPTSGIIAIKDGNKMSIGFIDGMPADHEHDSNGDMVYYTKSGKRITWRTHVKLASYTEQYRYQVLTKMYEDKGDPILSATTSCSKCGQEAMSDMVFH